MDIQDVLTAEAMAEVSRLTSEVEALTETVRVAAETSSRIASMFGRDAWFAEVDRNSANFQEYKAAFDKEYAVKSAIGTIKERLADLERPFYEARSAERDAQWQERGIDNAKITRKRADWWNENR